MKKNTPRCKIHKLTPLKKGMALVMGVRGGPEGTQYPDPRNTKMVECLKCPHCGYSIAC